MEFRALGLLEVVADDGRPVQVAPGKESALLGFLLLHGNEALSRDRIVDALWGERAPENARKSVQIYVSHLRKKLGAERIETTAAGYRLRVGFGEIDVQRFELLARDAGKALERGEVDRGEQMFDEALALWRGDALADFRFESFAQVEIRRLEELRDAAVADRLDARIAGGRASVAIPELEGLVDRRPLWERPRAQLMRALYLSGRQSDALELYRETHMLLRDELGVEPGPELQSLEHAILTHDPSLGQPASPPVRLAAGRGRPAALLVAGGLLVAIAAAAVAFELQGGDGRSVEVAANSVVAIDPSTDRIVAQIAAGTRPSRLAAASGTVWALSAGDGTITEIDGRQPRRLGDFGPASAPTDLAATGNLLWVGNAAPVARTPLSGAEGPASLSRFTGERHVLVGTSTLPHQGISPVSGRPPEARLLVAGHGLAWAVAPDSSVVAVDSNGRVRHRVQVQASSLAYGDRGLWILTQQNEVIRVDPSRGRVVRRIAIPSFLTLGGIAVGAGSVWVTSPFQGTVWRVDPGPPPSLRTVPLGFGAATIAFGDGAVWVGNNFDDTIERIDPATNVARKVASIPSPQDIAVAGDRVWVAAGSASGRSGPLASGPCEHVQSSKGRPDLIVASDFALEGGSSAFSQPMEQAVESVFRARGFRAGRFTVGLQSCDDASRAAGGLDIGQCLANGRAYALDSTVIGVIGDESPCATAQIPILNHAPHGPIALISPTSTSPFLTTPAAGSAGRGFAQLYARGVRNFARTVGADQLQVAADAKLASRLHLRRIGVVYNRLGLTSQAELGWFQEAARQAPGLHVVPVVWNEDGSASLERALRAAHVDGAFLTGAVTQGQDEAVEALVALREALPSRAPVIVTDWLSPWPSLKAAGPSYDGVYATLACPTLRGQLSKAAQAVLQSLPQSERVPCAVGPAVQAAKAMLGAIARSDGTRSSITHALFSSGLFDANGDLLNAPVTVFRLRRGARNATGLPYFQDATVDSVLHVPRFVPSSAG